MIKQPQATELLEGLYGGNGKVWISRNVTKEDDVFGIDLFAKVQVDVGASIGYHLHTKDAEVYYIVSGEGCFIDDGQVEKLVQAGDFCFITKGQSHGIRNTGETMLDMIAVVVS